MSYARLLFNTKLIFKGIKFEIIIEENYTYNSIAKPEKKI